MNGGRRPKRDRQRRSARSSSAIPIGSQQELAERLVERGFAVTQATVSRDIAELGIVKVARGDRHIYVSSEDVAAPPGSTPTSGCGGSSPTSRSRSAGAA